MNSIGIIGGMGPLATIKFMELLLEMNDVTKEQEHINQIVYNIATIPDRTCFIVDSKNENPYPYLKEIATNLSKQNVDYIVMTCFTAHYFINELKQELSIPFIDAIDLVVKKLKQNQASKVGIMASKGTIASEIFIDRLNESGIEFVYPNDENQKIVNKMIYDDLKNGKKIDYKELKRVENEFIQFGVNYIILGCTELSLIDQDFIHQPLYIDGLRILAANTLNLYHYNLREKYKKLLIP